MSINATLLYQHKQDIQIEIDGPRLADLFWDLDNEEQARFFNQLGEQPKLPIQLRSVTDCEVLNIKGRGAMRAIGEYSKS